MSKRGYDATEVFDLREYQPGDSIRSIHWKLSEKFDTVLVREASDTSNYDILILFDAGCFSYGYKYGAEVLSAAVSAAASVSERLMEHKFLIIWVCGPEMACLSVRSQDGKSMMIQWIPG